MRVKNPRRGAAYRRRWMNAWSQPRTSCKSWSYEASLEWQTLVEQECRKDLMPWRAYYGLVRD